MNLIRHLFTGKDNRTWDLGRISWGVSTLAVLAHDGWQVYHCAATAIVDVKDLAYALAAVVAAHGFALGQKAKTEPDPSPAAAGTSVVPTPLGADNGGGSNA